MEPIQPDPAGDERIDEIDTQWSLLRLAHRDTVTAAGPAREALVLRYNRAIRGYVGALLRDDHEADEVSQDAVVRLLKGDFARATPERGRFRDLLKVAVKNMVRTHQSKRTKRQGRNVDVAELAADPTDAPTMPHDLWDAQWRDALLTHVWRALEDQQRGSPGSVFFALLRLRADHPDDDIAALAGRLAATTGRELRADALRQQLRRARLRFAQLLVEEVSRSLDAPTPDRVEDELIALGLRDLVVDFLPGDWRTSGMLR